MRWRPVVKTIPYGLLAFGACFTWCFLYASSAAYRATVHQAIQKVAGIGFGGIAGHGAIHPFRWLRSLDEAIENTINNGLKSSERTLVYAINRAAEPFLLIVGALLAIGLGLYELAQYVVHVAPKVITKTVHETVVKPTTKIVKATAAITKAQFAALSHRVGVLTHQVAHLTAAAGHAIANPFPRIKTVERDLSGLRKRVKGLEKALAAGVGAALLIKALTKVGVGYIRCDRNKQLGKGICKTDANWVDEFLAGSLLLLGTTSFVEFVKEAQAGYELGIEGLQAFIREL